MTRDTHTEDIRNVNEGDSVTIETTTGNRFAEVECINYLKQQADPRTGEIRETRIWEFEVGDDKLVVSILYGLRSSADDPSFPDHREASLGNPATSSWQSVGYVDELQIHGPM